MSTKPLVQATGRRKESVARVRLRDGGGRVVLRIFESLHRDIEQLADDVTLRGSVWAGVRRRLSRRTGWVLVVAGSVLWLAYGVWLYANSPANPVGKLAIGALGIGFLLLLGSVVAERLQEFRTDPYRDIER